MSRTRSTSSVVKVFTGDKQYWSAYYSRWIDSTGGTTSGVFSSSSALTDEVPLTKEPFAQYPCTHSKRIITRRPGYGMQGKSRGSSVETWRSKVNAEGIYGTYDVTPNLQSPYHFSQSLSYDANALRNEALGKCIPVFKPELNALMCVADLRKFGGLFKSSTISNMVQLAKRKPHKLTKGKKYKFERIADERNISSDDAKSYLRHISNDYLSYSFGWVPFFKDLLAIQRVEHRMRKYRLERALSSVMVNHGSAGVSGGTARVGPFKLSGNYTYLTRARNVKAHATLCYRYDNRAISGRLEELRAYSSLLGLHCVAGLAWDLIPGSFIADWFFPVGQIVQKLDDAHNYYPKIEVVSCSTSIRDEDKCTVESGMVSYSPDMTFAVIEGKLAAYDSTVTTYARSIVSDITTASSGQLFSPRFGTKQASYLLAIAGQKLF